MGTVAAKREVYQELIQASKEQLAKLQEDVAFEQRYLTDLVILRDAVPSTGPNVRRKKRGRPVLNKDAIEPGSLTDQIVKILQEHGKTMRAADIARELAERGATTTAKGGMLPMALSTLSRRTKVFRRVDRGQYTLVERKAAD